MALRKKEQYSCWVTTKNPSWSGGCLTSLQTHLSLPVVSVTQLAGGGTSGSPWPFVDWNRRGWPAWLPASMLSKSDSSQSDTEREGVGERETERKTERERNGGTERQIETETHRSDQETNGQTER